MVLKTNEQGPCVLPSSYSAWVQSTRLGNKTMVSVGVWWEGVRGFLSF
jgi:hypothetical protein